MTKHRLTQKKTFSLFSFFLFSIILTGCASELTLPINNSTEATPVLIQEETSIIYTLPDEIKDIVDVPFTSADIVYCDEPYITVNNNIPFFTESQKNYSETFIYLSELDSLGRCGTCVANVCNELQPEGERGFIGNVKPSGWHTIKYTGVIEDNFLYHRIHLLGWQLSGINDDKRCLITGTRSMNVDGMLPFENRIDNAVEKNKELHVLYRVTPIFQSPGNDLVARGVLMEAYSVEDQGKTTCFCVFVYNKQERIKINYTTGDSYLLPESETNETSTDETMENYTVNINSLKFHYPDCPFVMEMADWNKREYTGNRAALINNGYSPCTYCSP